MAKKDTLINDLVMVSLHVKYDTGYRGSKEMQDIIKKEKNVTPESMRTGVIVLDKQLMSGFTSAISSLRTYYLDGSLPWERGNWRVVPVTAWQEFKDKLEELIAEAKTQFDDCVINNYSTLKAKFTQSVGTLSVEFPSKDDLQERFGIEYKMGQAASPDDIRIQGIDSVERRKISDNMKQHYEEQHLSGLKELAKRLTDAATDIGERVGEKDQKSKKYTRSIENISKLAETVEKLNVTGNDAIKQACETIRKDIAQWSPEAIKTTPMVRDHVQDAAGSVKDKLKALSL